MQTITQDHEPYTVNTGDIWQLGDHIIACGDARDTALHYPLLVDGVDCIWTDPPYGVMAVWGNNKRSTGCRSQIMSKMGISVISGDELCGDSLVKLITNCLEPAVTAARQGFHLFCCYNWRSQAEACSVFESLNIPLRGMIVWDKLWAGLSNPNVPRFRTQHELIGWGARGKYNWHGNLAQSDIWRVKRAGSHPGGHPTPKPVELVRKATDNATKPGDVIYDPFAGSCSLLFACEDSGRKARCIELEPKYVEYAINEWEQRTGRTARRIQCV